jgi:ABC-2 type transport system permease protein
MSEIIRHFKIWLMLVRINFMSQMEYRANFFTGILMEAGYLFAKVMYVIVVYRAGRSIAGFGADEILVFVGSYVAVTGFYAGVLAMNLFQLSNLVRDGSFDLLLVKPINTQFLATFRRSDMGPFVFDTVAGIVMIILGLLRMGVGFDIVGVLGWSFFAASGAAVGYALWLIPLTLVFRIVRADAIAGLCDSFWDFNNVPMIVYNRVGQAIGTFVIPIFVITNFPALYALGRLSPAFFAWGIVAPVLFGFIASRLWKSGLRHYASGGN